MNARLAMENDAVKRTLARTSRAFLATATADGRTYEVRFDVRTLVRAEDGLIREAERLVPVLYELAPDHPVRPPLVIAGQADLFNTHVHDVRDGSPLPPLPLVCLGVFQPAMTVADWIVATYYVLGWARIAADHEFNPAAAEYARRELGRGRFPIDRREFFDVIRATEAADPSRALRLRPRASQ